MMAPGGCGDAGWFRRIVGSRLRKAEVAMWIQKRTRDLEKNVVSPLPTQMISNEEFFPLLQTPEQKRIEKRIGELADGFGRVLGLNRRQFLGTAGGMAAAFLAMNEVFGPYFNVHAAEALDGPMRDEKWPKGQFIFDIQCHHVDVPRGVGKGLVSMFRQPAERFNPDLKGHKHVYEDLGLENFVKEIFFDSDTVMGCISGIPQKPDQNILPVERMVETKNKINQLAGSQRMVSHGLVAPNLKEYNKDDMHRQKEELKIDAWKMYTGLFFGRDAAGPWWMDDEKVAFPMFEVSKKIKVKNVCVHKGLPLFGFNEEHCHPKDIKNAAAAFPDLNFIIYHSGFRSLRGGEEIKREKLLTDKNVEWTTHLCEMRKANPKMTNVYMELGSTFGMTVVLQPLLTGHILGQILDAFGEDHILWGTDSIWWGTPQWQIEALRRFEMPKELQDKFGYKPLTKQIKDKIFGLNAAKIYGIDVEAKRQAIPKDYLTKLKMAYRYHGAEPSLAAYGWVEKEA
jgi:predicted TIM-barrel fold metal-dependent hydrolase